MNLLPREVQRVLNLFPRELIEGTPKDFLKANLRPHQRPDPRPKTRGATDPAGFWLGFSLANQLVIGQFTNNTVTFLLEWSSKGLNLYWVSFSIEIDIFRRNT